MSGNLLSGIKIIPRDQLDVSLDEGSTSPVAKSRKSRREKRGSGKSKSSDDELERIDKRKKKKKKWYSSDEDSGSSYGSETESSDSEDDVKRKSRKRKKSKKYSRKRSSSSEDELRDSESDCEGYSGKGGRSGGKGKSKKPKSKGSKDENDATDSKNRKDDKRKEMGLDWMLRPKEAGERKAEAINHVELEEPQVEEVIKVNPRELNPYLKNDGSGYPDEVDEGEKTGSSQLVSRSVIGDGGASWRLKALKRAQEQAAREGRRVEEVVGERWGSLTQLSIPAKIRAAPSRAHLHAIKNRQKGVGERTQSQSTSSEAKDEEDGKIVHHEYLKDVSVRHPEMKAPKIHDSLSWGKRRGQNSSNGDVRQAKTAVATVDKSHKLENQQDVKPASASNSNYPQTVEDEPSCSEIGGASEINASQKHAMSANQLAAKALQLRMKGKHEEADELQREVERMQQSSKEDPTRTQSTSRYVMLDKSLRKDESDDMHLAQTIMQNKRFSISGQADDEYDYEGPPQRKSKRKGGDGDHKLVESNQFAKRIMTQQERCQFCFENPNRPKHLVLSIANHTYLMLPQRQPVVEGHCCIVTTQHESATRSVDNHVWDEIRNFKKCLIMMFGKQEKDVVFIETVMGLAQRRRHCLVECIPLPQDIARQAPLYFKKAIDEAEDEWSQHNAKKLIDTSKKGLRGSIPKDFPYFYVEFGLDKGFVHVIDDEKQFNGSIGLNVIRGMLQLADEDMYRRRRHESVDAQKKAKLSFMQDWQPFDWTKQLE